MSNTSQSIKAKIKNISNEKNVDFNILLRFYVYDRFIERLAKSKYNNNFILKGGFYLSSLFGIDNRSTMDIDAAVRNTKFTDDELIKMVNEIINVDVSDNVRFEIVGTKPIREEDEYGGLRIILMFYLENIKDKFNIDFATGDPIFPGPDNYQYKSLIENDIYNVWTYNIETVIAEKVQTILSRGETSSRMKDYYDIYLIYKFKFDSIDKNKLKKACQKTFEKREYNNYIEDDLNTIKESDILRDKWKSYQNKFDYAEKVDFDDAINCLSIIVNLILN